jgi:Transmembrane protein 43
MADEEVAAATTTTEEVNRDFTETTTESYGSKVKDSCSGACTGFFLFFGSIALLIFNEGRTVKRARDLDEGRDKVLSVNLNNLTMSNNSITGIPANIENKLIHIVGDVSTTANLTDAEFGVPSENSNGADNLLKLRRSVEMYQWYETSSTRTTKNSDGSTTTTTTYSYSKQWDSRAIDSSRFHGSSLSTRTNPSFPFASLTLLADPILLGNRILLTDAAISYLDWYEPLSSVSIANVPDSTLQSRLQLYGNNGFFYRATSAETTASNPAIGDTRLFFDGVEPGTVSIIAKLNPSTGSSNDNDRPSLDSYTLERGQKTAAEMFTEAEANNTFTAWIYRFVGFFLMVVSILMLLQPIATAVDIIPFVGDWMQGALEGCIFPTIAILIALPIALFVIALSWLAYRPVIAVPICAVSLVILIWLRIRHKQTQQAANAVSTPLAEDGKPPNNYSSTTTTSAANPTDPSPYTSNYSSQPYTSTYSEQPTDPPPYTSTYNGSGSALAPAVPLGGYATLTTEPPPTTLYPYGSNNDAAPSAPVEDPGFASALDEPPPPPPPPAVAPSFYQPESDIAVTK